MSGYFNTSKVTIPITADTLTPNSYTITNGNTQLISGLQYMQGVIVHSRSGNTGNVTIEDTGNTAILYEIAPGESIIVPYNFFDIVNNSGAAQTIDVSRLTESGS